MAVATVVVSVVLVGPFLFAASLKLLGVRQSLTIRDQAEVGHALPVRAGDDQEDSRRR